jgi:hypothetical protein
MNRLTVVISLVVTACSLAACDRETRTANIQEPAYFDGFDEEVVFSEGPMSRGRADGVLYIETFERSGQYAWWKHPVSGSVIEVTGRVAEGSGAECGWIVNLAQHGKHTHGVQIVVFGDGRVWISPSLFDSDKSAGPEFREILHPAIKSAGEWNTLRVSVRKNVLGVHMNAEKILEPMKLNFPLESGRVALGVRAAGETFQGRVEITSFAIWPTPDLWDIPAEPATPPDAGEQPRPEDGQNTTGTQQ